jgi:hypothetical protein
MLSGTGSSRILASMPRDFRSPACARVRLEPFPAWKQKPSSFCSGGRAFGQPRSVAEIYGLLFISAQPLAMDDFIDRLSLSKGSASQGLKYLRNLGAIRCVALSGDRMVHYEAVSELSFLVARFVRAQVLSHLARGEERLSRIASLAKRLPGPGALGFGGELLCCESGRSAAVAFCP